MEILLTDLHKNLKSTDWLQHNTSEKWVTENPQLAKEYMDAVRGLTSVEDKGQGELGVTTGEFQLEKGTLKSCSNSVEEDGSLVNSLHKLVDKLDRNLLTMNNCRETVETAASSSRTEVANFQGSNHSEGKYCINIYILHEIIESILANYFYGCGGYDPPLRTVVGVIGSENNFRIILYFSKDFEECEACIKVLNTVIY